jgi:hypothetical protein
VGASPLGAVQLTETLVDPPLADAATLVGALSVAASADVADAPVEDQKPNATLAMTAAASATRTPMETQRLT